MKTFKIVQGPKITTIHNYSVTTWTQANQVFALDDFADGTVSFSFKSRLSIAEICRDYENQKVDTSPREYQREKVAKLNWQQNLILTVLNDEIAFVPEIHIRVIRFYNQGVPQWKLELLDGQQRTTTLIGFKRDKFALPLGIDTIDGFDVAGKKFSEIPQPLQEKFNSYMIFSSNYINITDADAAHLFIDVLNNNNEMNAQEKRNAERGPLAKWIRDTARFENTRHELFDRVSHKKDKNAEVMKYFASGFGVGRMQSDEWLAQLFYLTKKGWTSGITQNALTQWYRDTNSESGIYSSEKKKEWIDDSKMMEFILKDSKNLITNVPKLHKKKLSSMVSLVMCLFYQELKNEHRKVDQKTFVNKFFSVYDEWSDTRKQLYSGHLQWDNKKALGQFKSLFGGKNKNAMQSIRKVLVDLNMDENNLSEWGIVKVDPRRTFSADEIERKWIEQDCKCYYTGEYIELEECVGDHGIPWSWGIERGGVTEYDNLIVTTEYHNTRKSDKYTAGEYLKLLQEDDGLDLAA